MNGIKGKQGDYSTNKQTTHLELVLLGNGEAGAGLSDQV